MCGGGGGGSTPPQPLPPPPPKKMNYMYSLIFVLMGHDSDSVLQNSAKSHLNMDPKQYFEVQNPSTSNSLHIVLTRFSIVIIAKSKKGHNSLKSESGYLNSNPKLYAKYQSPSSSRSQDMSLTRIFYCYNSKVVKGA